MRTPLLAVATTVLLLVRAPIVHGQPTERVDLNTADATQLEALPGIGPRMARRILERRERRRFRRVRELLEIRGIGPKLLRRIEGQLVVE